MAGDWIKFEKATFDKPEVMAMAEDLGIPEAHVVGCLLQIWAWFDTHTTDGNAPSVTRALLDRKVSVTGFAQSMVSCGWLLHMDHQGVDSSDSSERGFVIPNFGRHNSESSKKRALTAKRVAKHKEKKRLGNAEVTQVRDLEKRREEKNTTTPHIPPKGEAKWEAPFWVNKSAWSEFEQHRKEVRIPLSDLSRTKAANQLKDLSAEQQQSCVDMTIQNGWRGLFPERVKNEGQRTNGDGHRKTTSERHLDALREIAERDDSGRDSAEDAGEMGGSSFREILG